MFCDLTTGAFSLVSNGRISNNDSSGPDILFAVVFSYVTLLIYSSGVLCKGQQLQFRFFTENEHSAHASKPVYAVQFRVSIID